MNIYERSILRRDGVDERSWLQLEADLAACVPAEQAHARRDAAMDAANVEFEAAQVAWRKSHAKRR